MNLWNVQNYCNSKHSQITIMQTWKQLLLWISYRIWNHSSRSTFFNWDNLQITDIDHKDSLIQLKRISNGIKYNMLIRGLIIYINNTFVHFYWIDWFANIYIFFSCFSAQLSLRSSQDIKTCYVSTSASSSDLFAFA